MTDTLVTTRQPIADEQLRHARASLWCCGVVELSSIPFPEGDYFLWKPTHLIADEEARRYYKHVLRPSDGRFDSKWLFDEYAWFQDHGWIFCRDLDWPGYEEHSAADAVEMLKFYLDKVGEPPATKDEIIARCSSD